MNLLFPTQMFEPGIQTSADPFPGSAGSVSNTSTIQWSPHTVVSPPSAPATRRPASTASAAEVFCSLAFAFVPWQVQLWQNHSSGRDWHMCFRTVFPSGALQLCCCRPSRTGQRLCKGRCPCCVVCCHLQAVGTAALCWY